jgi:hypothetical protein
VVTERVEVEPHISGKHGRLLQQRQQRQQRQQEEQEEQERSAFEWNEYDPHVAGCDLVRQSEERARQH